MARKLKNALPRDLDDAADKLKPEETTTPGPLDLPVVVPKGLKELLD